MNNSTRLKKNYSSQFLPLGIILFLGLATIFTFIVSQRRQELRSKALSDNAILSFSPTTVNITSNGTFNVATILNTTPQAAVGTDILVQFDSNKLTLTNVTKGSNTVLKTFAPIVANDANGTFDIQRVKDCANLGSFNNSTQNCPSGSGIAEFGVVAFDWVNNSLTGSFAGIASPLATLTFQAKPNISGNTTISYKYIDANSTTDSNVVANPTAGASPEDILVAPTSIVAITITTISASPSPTPSPSSNPSPTPTRSPSPTPTRSPSPTPTRSPSPTPSTTPSVSPNPSVSPTPGTNPSPSASPANPQIILELNLEGTIGTTTQKPDKQFIVTFKKTNTADQVQTVTFTANNTATYSNLASPIVLASPGAYSITVKAPSYLSHTFPDKQINQGLQTISLVNDFTLLAGDAVETTLNKIDIYDYNNVVSNFGCKSTANASPPPGKSCISFKSDLDYDGDIDIYDYSFMVGNFGSTGN